MSASPKPSPPTLMELVHKLPEEYRAPFFQQLRDIKYHIVDILASEVAESMVACARKIAQKHIGFDMKKIEAAAIALMDGFSEYSDEEDDEVEKEEEPPAKKLKK